MRISQVVKEHCAIGPPKAVSIHSLKERWIYWPLTADSERAHLISHIALGVRTISGHVGRLINTRSVQSESNIVLTSLFTNCPLPHLDGFLILHVVALETSGLLLWRIIHGFSGNTRRKAGTNHKERRRIDFQDIVQTNNMWGTVTIIYLMRGSKLT